jgi:hypothetical protein
MPMEEKLKRLFWNFTGVGVKLEEGENHVKDVEIFQSLSQTTAFDGRIAPHEPPEQRGSRYTRLQVF